jgi:hypothetical protein
MDSAYWKEWEMFSFLKPFGLAGFLIIHIPIVIILFAGALLINEANIFGTLISIIASLGGVFAFFFHNFHLRKGKKEFNTFTSRLILISTLILSIIQFTVAIMMILS